MTLQDPSNIAVLIHRLGSCRRLLLQPLVIGGVVVHRHLYKRAYMQQLPSSNRTQGPRVGES